MLHYYSLLQSGFVSFSLLFHLPFASFSLEILKYVITRSSHRVFLHTDVGLHDIEPLAVTLKSVINSLATYLLFGVVSRLSFNR